MLASDTFAKAAGKQVGDEVQFFANRQYVTATIAGRFALFPTYEPKDNGAHLLVANLDRLLHAANRAGGGDIGYANGWLAGVDAAPSRESLAAAGVSAGDEVVETEPTCARRSSAIRWWPPAGRHPLHLVRGSAGAGRHSVSPCTRTSAQTRARVRHPADDGLLRPADRGAGELRAGVRDRDGDGGGSRPRAALGRLMIGYMGVTGVGAKVLPPFVSPRRVGAHSPWRTGCSA
ncbi:MAG: hypothetical protein U0531_13640 [Dehalococcoidia bacterium]